MFYPQHPGAPHSPMPQGHSPQPGYGYGPPPGQHPPPQGQFPPLQGQYPPQQQPGYGTPPPQAQHPPAQGHYGQPSPQPPHVQYGAPPPQGYPPQQMQQYPPSAQNAYPHPQPGYGPPPTQHPSMQQYGAPAAPLGQPSPGYIPGQMAKGDASRDADALRRALERFRADNTVLINVLSKPDPLQMGLLKVTYGTGGGGLESKVASKTSGHYRQGLVALLQGPLVNDVTLVNGAVKGLGTKEIVLNDVLLNRSNADMNAIKVAYMKEYNKSLYSDVSDDLSLLTKKLFEMIMAAKRPEESTVIVPGLIENDVNRLCAATERDIDGMTVCSILTGRSDGQLRAINNAFNNRSSVPFDKVIEKGMSVWRSSHTRSALLTIWRRAIDGAMYDAEALEDCMRGVGTKDDLLVQRIVRIHWDRQHLAQVKNAYRKKYGKNLSDRVRGETSGDYKRLMLAILE